MVKNLLTAAWSTRASDPLHVRPCETVWDHVRPCETIWVEDTVSCGFCKHVCINNMPQGCAQGWSPNHITPVQANWHALLPTTAGNCKTADPTCDTKVHVYGVCVCVWRGGCWVVNVCVEWRVLVNLCVVFGCIPSRTGRGLFAYDHQCKTIPWWSINGRVILYDWHSAGHCLMKSHRNIQNM